MRWADRYRPSRFEDVVGQVDVTAKLAAYVRSDAPPHLILSGRSGTGKTTLARIYAKALICAQPVASGSPCERCAHCEQFEMGSPNFHAFNAAIDNSKADVEDALDRLHLSPLFGRHHIVFFDEAHRLTPSARDAFLVPLEANNPRVKILFSMIDPLALPLQVRSRCRELRLRAPTSEEALDYLHRIAAAETVVADPAALRLVALLSPSFRSLAENLESSVIEGKLTVEGARARLLHDRSLAVAAYLRKLASGDFVGQWAALMRGAPSPKERVSEIREALSHLHLRYVTYPPVILANDPNELLYDDLVCKAVISAFAVRAASREVSLHDLSVEMLNYWTFLPAEIDESALKLLAITFNAQIGRAAPTPPVPVSSDLKASAKQIRKARDPLLERRKRAQAKPVREVDAHYLNRRQVTEIYEAATFLLQRYGDYFNASVTLTPRQTGLSDRQAAAFSNRLWKEARQRIEHWSEGNDTLYRVILNERVVGELVSTCIFHVSAALAADLEKWLCRRCDRLGLSIREPLDVLHPDKREDRIIRHWRMARKLWRSTDPTLRGVKDLLISELKVPASHRRSAGQIACDRYSISERISAGARQTASDNGFRHRSALAASRPNWLFRGWEFEAYDALKAQIRKVQAHRAVLAKKLADAGDPLTEQHIKSVILQLDNEEHRALIDELRDVRGWWNSAQYT